MYLTSEGTTILVAEDEPEVRDYLDIALRRLGYAVEFAEDGEEAIAWLGQRDKRISLLLLDIMMPRKDGLETLRHVRRFDPQLPVIMLSGCSSPLQAAEAMKSGANDFLAKPVGFDELHRCIQKALHFHSDSLERVLEQTAPALREEGFVFSNPWSKKIDAWLGHVASSDVPVLLRGETGVGKEVVARQLHARSPRAGKPFLKVNCAALPSELVESELFGYERGAFTGAFKNTAGKFELADGGTILLDEIGDMDCKLQAKLLQVLQDREFLRLGAKEPTRVNVRVMAATHCDLEKAMVEGRFREDLYYRLNVIDIRIPALRERKDEIVPLAEYLIKKHSDGAASLPKITPSLRHALLEHDWPGNIRELENVARKLLVLQDPDGIAQEIRFKARKRPGGGVPAEPVLPRKDWPATEARLPAGVKANTWNTPPLPTPQAKASAAPDVDSPARQGGGLVKLSSLGEGGDLSALEKVDRARKEAEATAILAALNATRWNRRQAALLLKVDYKALLYKMRKLGIGTDEPGAERARAASSMN